MHFTNTRSSIFADGWFCRRRPIQNYAKWFTHKKNAGSCDTHLDNQNPTFGQKKNENKRKNEQKKYERKRENINLAT